MERSEPRRLKPVPLAPTVFWSNLRMQVLPVVLFASVIGVVAYLWRTLEGGAIPGVAEGVRSTITVPQNAVLSDLRVSPYQWVEAGETLATLIPVEDPRLEVDVLQSELQLARLQMEPSLADQNALDYERLRVEALRLQQEVAAAKVELARAENALKRNQMLRGDQLVSEDDYDLSVRDRDLYLAEIAQKSQALEELTGRMNALRALGEPESAVPNETSRSLLDQIARKLAETGHGARKIDLVSPISGMVHLVNRRPGEIVMEGEPLVTVHASRSDRIVGYLRQPYPVDPEIGMKVEVLTRTRSKQRFISEIRQIGVQMEVITNSLAFLRPGLLVDAGLPVVVAVPPNVNLRPGETVDLVFESQNLRAGARRPAADPL